MGTHARNRRYLRRTGLLALVVVLGVGVWQGVAAATGGKTVKIQRHNANCGRSTGTPQIGTATFSRDGNTVFVEVNLTNADPFTDYVVELWMIKTSDGRCKFVDDMGPIGTDGAGQGTGSFSSSVDPKANLFFIDVSIGDTETAPNGGETFPLDNDSLIVKLKR